MKYIIMVISLFLVVGCGIEDSVNIRDNGEIHFKRVISFNEIEENSIAEDKIISSFSNGVLFKETAPNFMSTQSVIISDMIKKYTSDLKSLQKNNNIKNLEIYQSSIDSNHPSYTIEATFNEINTFNKFMDINFEIYSYKRFKRRLKRIVETHILGEELFEMPKSKRKFFNDLKPRLKMEKNMKSVYFNYFIALLPSKIRIVDNDKQSKIIIFKEAWSKTAKREINIEKDKPFIKTLTLNDMILSKVAYMPSKEVFYTFHFKSKKIFSNTHKIDINNNKVSWNMKQLTNDNDKRLIIKLIGKPLV